MRSRAASTVFFLTALATVLADPLCCVRFVHIPKAGGSTFEMAMDHFAIDAVTFHNPWYHFEENLRKSPAREGKCFFGTALRHPVGRFISAFDYCFGRSCPRPWSTGGFLDTRPGWACQRAYVHGNLTIAQYLNPRDRHDTEPGNNIQTKQLGLRPTEAPGLTHGKADSARIAVQKTVLVDNAQGRRVLERAKRVLEQMDFVLITEDLSSGLDRVFNATGEHMPHQVVNPAKRERSQLSSDERREIEQRNALDLELYEFALTLVAQRNHSGLDVLRGSMVNSSPFKRNTGASKKKKRKKETTCLVRGSVRVPGDAASDGI